MEVIQTVINGTFDSGIDWWTDFSGSVVWDTDRISLVGDGAVEGVAYTAVELKAGVTYSFSTDFVSGGGSLAMKLLDAISGGNLIHEYTSGIETLTVPSDATYYIRIATGSAVNTDYSYYDNVSLTYNQSYTTDTDPFNDGSLVAGYNLDSDANDYVGTAHGTATDVTYVASKFSNGVKPNNSNTASNVDFPYSITSAFMLSGWFKIDGDSTINGGSQSATIHPIFSQSEDIESAPIRIELACTLDTSVNEISINLGTDTSNRLLAVLATGITDYTSPVFLTIEWDGSTADATGVKASINDSECTEVSRQKDGTAITPTGLFNLRVGSSITGTPYSSYLNGSVDQMMHLNRVLTASEKTELYNMVSPALLTTDTDPFGDGSLVSSKTFDGSTADLISSAGTVTDNITTYASSALGQKAVFDGSKYAKTDTININTNKYSYSLWVSDFVHTSDGRWIDWTVGRGIIGYDITGDEFGVYTGSAWDYTGVSLAGKTDFMLNLVSNGTGFKIYVDSVLVYTNTTSAMTAIDGSSSHVIGADYFGTGSFIDCGIDQFMIFNREITQTEIDALYLMEVPTTNGLALFFNGIETTQVFFNGVELTEMHFNGTLLQ